MGILLTTGDRFNVDNIFIFTGPKHRICQKPIYMNCGTKDAEDSNGIGVILEVACKTKLYSLLHD